MGKMPADLVAAIQTDHRATDALLRGDPEPKKRMFSRRDDVSLANPIQPAMRGWDRIAETLDGVASSVRDGKPQTFERISDHATEDLGYIHEIERCPGAKFGGSDEATPFELRVTTIYRREEGGWKISHRHADSLTALRPIESIAGK